MIFRGQDRCTAGNGFLVKFAKKCIAVWEFLGWYTSNMAGFIVEMTIIEKNEYLDYRLEEMSQPHDLVFC